LVRRIVNLHFTNPKGGEVWEKGRTYTIRWDKAGGIGNVKILLKDPLNQSSLWVSQGDNNVIRNTGYYSFRVPTTLPDSAYEFHIMTPDESYKNTSKKFYIGRTDTDLRVKTVNFTRRTEYIGAKDMPIDKKRYIVAEIWLKNKGSKRMNSVTVTWQIVKEPEGEIKTQGEKIFRNLSPGPWYQQNLKVLYATWNDGPKWENLRKTGGSYHLKLQADPDNVLDEIELTRGDNFYSTEVVNGSNYW
jgi:hypothetical protein